MRTRDRAIIELVDEHWASTVRGAVVYNPVWYEYTLSRIIAVSLSLSLSLSLSFALSIYPLSLGLFVGLTCVNI